MDQFSLFEVVLGSYERLLYGLRVCLSDDIKDHILEEENKSNKKKFETLADELPFYVNPFFIFPAHIGCIKTVSIGESRYLASGSTDEFIKLYDMKSRKELGSLQEHKGTITSLEFVGKTHMISGAEDSTLLIWRTKDWEVLKKLKGHTGKVLSISVHPSGKLALSVGDDKLMLLWNMMTGQKASSIRLPKVADMVSWDKKGELYAVMYDTNISIYHPSNPEPTHTINATSLRSRYLCIEWVLINDKSYLIAGCGDGSLVIYGSFKPELTLYSFKTLEIRSHQQRIKSLKSINILKSNLERITSRYQEQVNGLDKSQFLATASSSGLILIWDLELIVGRLEQLEDSEPKQISLLEYTKALFKPLPLSSEDLKLLNKVNEDDKSLILGAYSAGVRLTCLSLNLPFH